MNRAARIRLGLVVALVLPLLAAAVDASDLDVARAGVARGVEAARTARASSESGTADARLLAAAAAVEELVAERMQPGRSRESVLDELSAVSPAVLNSSEGPLGGVYAGVRAKGRSIAEDRKADRAQEGGPPDEPPGQVGKPPKSNPGKGNNGNPGGGKPPGRGGDG
ncbi:MAG: hypothetical protein OEX04_01630 [Acidimicrobiia bacterium]|nr:hypothetical protein [Acidimicrobiia bacterium]MDH4306155.1 hypothetical protein [Acidimicrobiia bacterium]MDH5292099.1 hypothetical protein [Acidimicrobiia bacterium]